LDVYGLLWKEPALRPRLIESLVTRFESSEDFHHANVLMAYLDRIDNAPPNLIDRLAAAPKANRQLAGAYDVKDKLPKLVERLRGK